MTVSSIEGEWKVWGAVCNITNSVDRIQFCWTEYNSVYQNTILPGRITFCRQNVILSNRIRIMLTELYSVDRVIFCPTEFVFCWTELYSVRQKCILLDRIVFCQQNS